MGAAMDRAHIYDYLYKESSKEKTMNSRLRHFTRNSAAYLEPYPECHL